MKTELSALFAALLLCACTASAVPPPAAAPATPTTPAAPAAPAADAAKPLAGQWRITGAHGLRKVSPKTVITLDGGNMQFSAATNCNRLFGAYETEPKGRTLRFMQIASTLKACPDMAAEQKLAESLERVRGYRLQNGSLELLDAQGRTLVRGLPAGGAE